MNSCFQKFFLVLSVLILSYMAEGQSSRVATSVVKFKYFQIPGRIKMDQGDPSGTIVNLINLDSKQTEKSVTVPSSGKFDLELSYFKEYKIKVTKEGYYDKEIDVSTVIPRNVWDKDSIFPPYYIVVSLYKKVEGVVLSFEGKTIGKVSYSPNGTLDNFDSNVLIDDKVIQDEIKEAIQNKDDRVFNQKVAEALEYEKKEDLPTAFNIYNEAIKLKPSDKFVKEKLKELASDLKNLSAEAKILAEYNRLIALGDANVTSLKFVDAILNFKGALKVRPNDPIAVSKLADAEKLLAMAGEKAKNDAEFNRLIAAGDANVTQSKYAEAITSFKSALTFKPGDSMALARITDAEKLLAMAGEKAKKDAEFNRLIAAGDANVTQSKYAEAITSFKSALTFKPGDSMALARIGDTEKLFAMAGEKAKKDAEFNRLIAAGDANVTQSKYAEAITNFKSALTFKPGDSMALARIADAEKLLAMAGEKAKKDVEFNRLIGAGDAKVSVKEYAEALSLYKNALSIKSNEIVNAKIKDTQSIIDALAAKALADQKLVAENKISSSEKLYLEKIKTADENFKNSQWSGARFFYIEALKIKQSDGYALGKVDACDKMIDSGITAEKMQEYTNQIAKGDDEMKGKNYSNARFYYRNASDILKWETYPRQQLSEIDRMVAEKLNESDLRLFKENLAKADDAFNRKEYPMARFYYNKVIELSQNDHVTSRLKEIESIVNGSESKNISAAYDDFIKKGEEAVKQKNNAIARFYFQKANALKPGENLPKQELMKIDSGALNP
jgi:hypothetical protein